MKKSLCLAVALSALSILQPAGCIQKSFGSKGDAHIRTVYYDPSNVVKIVTRYGNQTFVLFSDDEKIQDIGAGDTTAWDIGVSTQSNSFFIKPKGISPDTNLTVVTNQHYYNFVLTVDTGAKPSNMYMIRFRYPQTLAAQKAHQKAKNLLNATQAIVKNWNYTLQGSDSIAPFAAWDDSHFTYLRFAPHKDFPSIYQEAEDGTENLVNTHVEGDTIVIHAVAKKWVLRKGNLVTCIFNESFDAQGDKQRTQTASPHVERVLKGGQHGI